MDFERIKRIFILNWLVMLMCKKWYKIFFKIDERQNQAKNGMIPGLKWSMVLKNQRWWNTHIKQIYRLAINKLKVWWDWRIIWMSYKWL